jgi:quercetin dioxygenase-like cupin family protein
MTVPRIAIGTPAKTRAVPLPAGLAGEGEALAYFDGEAPLHLHELRLAPGATVAIGPHPADTLIYVRSGAVEAGSATLPEGSSLIVEAGASLEVNASGETVLLDFAAASTGAPAARGGHVHLLPADRVPRNAEMGGVSGVSGAMHADAQCTGCSVWLHENHFPGSAGLAPEEQQRGVHSHSEDEIIFVTGGAMRLGTKLYGPGTALAIAADTLYSFTAGPDGLDFINFRAGLPGEIQFASGARMDEPGYWRDRLPRPEYLEVA